MRKPFVAAMFRTASVSVLTVLLVAVLGPLLTPVSSSPSSSIQNGTEPSTSAPSSAPVVVSEVTTTISPFLPDLSETTLHPQLSNQVDELTTTPEGSPSQSTAVSPSTLLKRHSSIPVSSSDSVPRFLSKSLAWSSSSKSSEGSNSSGYDDDDDGAKKPQSNGTNNTTEEDLFSSNTSERSGGGDGDDNALPTTTDKEIDSAAVSASVSTDKEESDTYFSDADAAGEGDSSSAAAGENGDTIFPPEDDALDTQESVEATTYASLLRPNPTSQQQFAQRYTKGGKSGGSAARTLASRIGIRGLSSKSDLNAITSEPTTTLQPLNNDNSESDSSGGGEIGIVKDSDSGSDDESGSSGSSSDLTGSKFYSRSNAVGDSSGQQELLRAARPTASVIHSNGSISSRVVKRKKIPIPGRGSLNHTGTSLSSIYNNSLLTSSPSSSSSSSNMTDVEEGTVPEVTTIPPPPPLPSGSTTDSLLSTVGISDSTTESNNLLNASQELLLHSSNITQTVDQQKLSSPPSTSGASNNLTTPVTPFPDESNTTTSSSNGTVSSSRAILGFGTGSAAHGKIKRPKPIIIRDHDESLYNNNNISEAAGAATTENAQSGLDEASSTLLASGPGAAAGEEVVSKPVNALPSPQPPFKVRRKYTSRRVTTRPSIDAAPATPAISISTTDAVIHNITNLMAEAASGASSYMHMHGIVRPSMINPLRHGGPVAQAPELFSSRRVYKEEFRVSTSAYGFDRNDEPHHDHHDDHDHDGDDVLQGTTEFFSMDSASPTPHPIGARHQQPEYNAESGANEEEGKDGKVQPNESRYRDYYSDGGAVSSVEHGSGNNLHIKSDSHDSSPVTVTVTHTVVHATPQISPTASVADSGLHNNGRDFAKDNNPEHEYDGTGADDVEKGSHPNLRPTPALPSSIFGGSTAAINSAQSPPDITRSAEDVQVSTARFAVTSAGIQTTHFGEPDGDHHDESDHRVREQGGVMMENHKRGSERDESERMTTPVMMMAPHDIHPTPVISSKGIKSVYFTQVEHPHFSSSSYEFTTSSMYSYYFPDHDVHHDGMSHHDHEDDDHHPPHPGADHHGRVHPSPSNAEHSPPDDEEESTTSSGMTTISEGRGGVTASPTTPQFWDELGLKSVTLMNLTKSSSSQVPVTMDQENGGVPTPTIDIDVYPPPGIGPNSKVEEASTTTTPPPAPTGRPFPTQQMGNNSRVPGSAEENEISEEEMKKQQLDAIGKTTMKPEVVSGSSSTGVTSSTTTSTITTTAKGDQDSEGEVVPEGGLDKAANDTAKEGTKDIPSSDKTPFGIGESFGIGSVHVPIMVQMDLDLAQPVFCSHLKSFKEMIVTVYGTQKNLLLVGPEQIIIFTEPGCTSKSQNESDSSAGTSPSATTLPPATARAPGTSPVKLVTTPKGTYPLTSPPQPITEGDDHTKSARSGKDISVKEASNLTTSSSPPLNKSSELSNKLLVNASSTQNKSAAINRSRRSTKMATAPATSKNSNFSEDPLKPSSNTSNANSSNAENLFSVYFYVNDKNGSYDQDLTSSFVRLWNDSSRSNNTSAANGTGEGETIGSGPFSGGNGSSEMFIKRVKKVGMITASHLVSTQDSSDENSGIIVAITVASIVAVCLFVLGVGLLVMRHRQSQTKFAKRCTPVTLDDYSLDNISVYNSFRRKQRLRGSKRSYTNAAFDDPNAPSRPLSASALGSILTDTGSLETEFRAIPNVSPTLDDIPNGAETKNRYANVIPMPDTRVLLTFQEDTPNSDYINANYVRGVNGDQKRYIITQGPLEDTVVDFWRMVWEQQIRTIFMLTDFAEAGIAKCAEYYPRSETIDCSQLHGDFQITLEKRDIADNCITSYLVLKDMERNLRRDVVHFWYHSWPEKGVPASPKMTIDFLSRSRKFTKEPTPVLVHCSPGTGRSGTIVACDIAMKEYDTQNKVDIPRIVMKIRQDRAGAVQTKEQYLHIYEVVHSHASRIGGTSLESI